MLLLCPYRIILEEILKEKRSVGYRLYLYWQEIYFTGIERSTAAKKKMSSPVPIKPQVRKIQI